MREFGVSDATIYTWKKEIFQHDRQQAKRLRDLEEENRKLKRIVADQALDIVMLKDVNSKGLRQINAFSS